MRTTNYFIIGCLFWLSAVFGQNTVQIPFNTTTTNGGVLIGTTQASTSTSGPRSVLIGSNAGRDVTADDADNTFVGHNAGLLSNNAVGWNTFIGSRSGENNISGVGNAFLGYETGFNATGNYNVYIGNLAGAAVSGTNSGYHNVFIGANTGFGNSTGYHNTFVGTEAGESNSTGANNTYIGRLAGNQSQGSNNIYLGAQSGLNNTGSNNIFIGAGTTATLSLNNRLLIGNLLNGDMTNTERNLTFTVDADADSRAIVQSGAAGVSGLRFSNLTNAVTPVANPGTGVLTVNDVGDVILVEDQGTPESTNDWHITGNAGTNAATHFLGTTDDVDLAFRRNNLRAGRISTSAVMLGRNSGNATVFPNNVVMIGENSGANTTGANNTFVGAESGNSNNTGNNNTFLGHNAGINNTSGNFNTYVGLNSGAANIGGSNNTILGPANTGGNVSNRIILADGQGNQRLYIDDNGDVGIGLNNNTPAGNRLEIESDITNASGLRFSSLDDTFNPIVTNTKFLTVDANGDVVLENVDVSSLPIDDISIYTEDGTLTADREMLMDDFNLHFNTTGSTTGGRIYIGEAPSYPTTTGDYKLYVEGGILTEKVKVALRSTTDWADYVFDENYQLMPLSEVEAYVNENKHLPGIPSAQEMVCEGIDLGAMQSKQMEKIEELTLHIINQEKTMKSQQQEIDELKAQVKLLLQKQ